MKRSPSSKRKAAVFPILAIISLGTLAGCELLVDFDRTLIDGGTLGEIDGSASDVFVPQTDSGNDAEPTDAAPDVIVPLTDSGADTGITDAGDAEVDADI